VADGLIAPGSVAWRVNREAALLLGGGRALLMQIAHPKVAAGVAEHSDFMADPIGRLKRTLQLSLALTFGTPAEIRRSASRINTTHQRVRGDGYSALDPELLLWVHATLIDSALVTYETFIAQLSDAEAEEYYRQTQPVGALLGIPPARFPRTLAAFRSYVAEMLAGPASPDGTGRRLAAAVLKPPIRGLPGFASAPLRVITTGLLPEPLRRAYGLSWTALDRTAFGAARVVIRSSVMAAPATLRAVPAARRAERRYLIAAL
jgi:uncharacterized protein (DUF2236 family)